MHNSDDSQLSRALNAALEHAASQVDWPALNDHLAARLKATHRVRRSPGLTGGPIRLRHPTEGT